MLVVGHVSSRPLLSTPLWQVPLSPLHTLSQVVPFEAAALHWTRTGDGGGAGGEGGGDNGEGGGDECTHCRIDMLSIRM